MKKNYRIAIIGYTGRGGYGHELDIAFDGVEDAKNQEHILGVRLPMAH